MKTIRQFIGEYLAIRRSLGYKLQDDERRLLDFARFLATEKSPFITTALALRWASPITCHYPNTPARRLATVRLFAQFVYTQDPRTEIPPRDYLPYHHRRLIPYIYSSEETDAILEAAEKLPASTFHRRTANTFFGLLVVTGIRVGEAIALDREDFNQRDGITTIHCGKFGKSREIPLHPTATTALAAYGRERDRLFPRPKSAAFFLSGKGTRLIRQKVSMTFTRLLRRAGLLDRKPRRPRIHDLRHTFAVHTLCDWYRAGLDVQAKLPLLSTYLGHVSPSSTYWYLTAVPELMELAAKRLDNYLKEQS
jgi:integrase/recombinase XerD